MNMRNRQENIEKTSSTKCTKKRSIKLTTDIDRFIDHSEMSTISSNACTFRRIARVSSRVRASLANRSISIKFHQQFDENKNKIEWNKKKKKTRHQFSSHKTIESNYATTIDDCALLPLPQSLSLFSFSLPFVDDVRNKNWNWAHARILRYRLSMYFYRKPNNTIIFRPVFFFLSFSLLFSSIDSTRWLSASDL